LKQEAAVIQVSPTATSTPGQNNNLTATYSSGITYPIEIRVIPGIDLEQLYVEIWTAYDYNRPVERVFVDTKQNWPQGVAYSYVYTPDPKLLKYPKFEVSVKWCKGNKCATIPPIVCTGDYGDQCLTSLPGWAEFTISGYENL